MQTNRSVAVLLTVLSSIATAHAQATEPGVPAPRRADSPIGEVQVLHEQPDDAEVRFTLWMFYLGSDDYFADHAQYLADLQSRWRAKGVRVAVAMPAAAAAKRATQKPGFLVAATDVTVDQHAHFTSSPLFLCRGTSSEALLSWPSLDGAVDILRHYADGGGDLQLEQTRDVLAYLIGNVADGGDFKNEVERCLKVLPQSGQARAAAVLYQWWCQGDLEAADEAVDAGINALAGEAVPMTVFADLVLRGDRNDPGVAKRLAVAMAPAAATASDGAFTQLVYLRALLRAGQDRLAGRIAATMPKRLQDRPRDQLVFAETLMEAATPAAHRDLAERAIEAAEATPGFEREVFGCRHKVATRCGDSEAADKVLADYRNSQVGQGDLNNDAWYLIVRPETMGRFDTLALAQAKELQTQMGAQLTFGNKDTVALAWFVNGHVDTAVELQTEAAQAANQNPVYVGRLNRFEATQRRLAKAKAVEPKSQDGK